VSCGAIVQMRRIAFQIAATSSSEAKICASMHDLTHHFTTQNSSSSSSLPG
jgi:hypothetical protein